MRRIAIGLACLAIAGGARAQPPAPSKPKAPSNPSAPAKPAAPEAPAAPASDDKTEAMTRFTRGKELMREEAWDAALAEFRRSRELFPSRGNTQNAAVCLGKLHRFDEALDMFEKLLSEFPNFTPEERSQIEGEISTLRARIGAVEVLILEPGAAVLIDGRARGTTPLSGPLRVSAGSHVVRLYKEGFAPLEVRIEVAGRQNTQVDGRLVALTRSGRLKIVEQGGKPADVLVDNTVVGKTPWEGSLAAGNHAVALRGAGNLGTPPVSVPIKLNEVTPLTLALGPLECELRVQPSPATAVVAIDGVTVGRGIWEGRIGAGAHRVEAAAEGFLPARHPVTLRAGERQVAPVELERDPSSPLWRTQNPPRVILDLHIGALLAPLLGGDLLARCTGSCSKPFPLGGLAVLHAGYRLSSGLGLTADVGYLLLQQRIASRPAELTPQGLPPNKGTLDDRILLQGLTAGGSVSLHVGRNWPFFVRVGGGVLLASVRDERSGSFTTLRSPTTYAIGPLTEVPRLTGAYVAPELRFGRRLGSHAELSLSAKGLIVFVLSQTMWQDEHTVLAGKCGGADPATCDGLATFGKQSLVGKTLVLVSPGLALSLDF